MRAWSLLVPVVALGGAVLGCAGGGVTVKPDDKRAAGEGWSDAGVAPFESTEAVTDGGTKPVVGLATVGSKPAVVARRAPLPDVPLCKKEERGTLSFNDAPLYSDRVEKGATFTARLFVGNGGNCTRKVVLPLSFTPPRTTASRTVELAAHVPARGAFVDVKLEGDELAELNITPGRYAITFAVNDEDGRSVGRALSGNPFRIGRDEIAIVASPVMPEKLGIGEELVVPIQIRNIGDTANKATPLIVFTRPGDTNGIEHYDATVLAVPGVTGHTFKLSQAQREAKGIKAGAWLVTITVFDGAGDRMNSFAGLRLVIGTIDLRLEKPTIASRVKATDPIRATFKIENKGDTADKVTAVVALTKPGTTYSREFTFTREVPSGITTFEAVIDAMTRRARGVDKGIWLVTTAAFKSSGERIKSFAGQYLEIYE